VNKQDLELTGQLSNSVFIPDVTATDKRGVLAELTDQLVTEGRIQLADRDEVLGSLLEREAKMSTGMQYGVAIPHAKTDCVKKLVGMIAISHTGVPFASLDGAPAAIFVLTLSPRSDTNSHIKFLAEVSRKLSNQRVRKKLLEAKTREEMVAAICKDPRVL